MASIHEHAEIAGQYTSVVVSCLIDTGAEISFLPKPIAYRIGAWRTGYVSPVTGIHGDSKTLPIVVARFRFTTLNNVVSDFPFVMSDTSNEIIVGMDILRPLGISIDTRTGKLLIRNEMWEAVKTLAGVGVVCWGGIKILDALANQD